MSLKDALLECMEGTLSPDGTLRNASEERLKVLEVTERFGIDLVEVILEPSYPPPLRQLASVLLRQYVDMHWTSVAEKFSVPEVSDEVKCALKSTVPLALTDPNSKIRNSVASVISKIAHWDWPECWPNLFQVLLENLKDPKGVQGAMRVLTELMKEVTDAHIVQVVPIILPEMLRILADPLNYTVDTRMRAVEIFRTTVRLITTVADVDKTAINTYLGPSLEPFLQQFVVCLQEKSTEYKVYGLQKSIVKAISFLLRECPKRMAPFLQFILKPIWDILTSNIDEFRRYYNGEADDPDVDSDGEECGIEGAVFSVFGLIQIMLENPSMNGLVKSGLVDLIYYIIFYMQVPQERVETWISSPSTFAADEDDDNATYTLRVCAQDLLVLACDEFPESYAALGQAVDKHLSGPTDWRLQEACLYAVCSLGTRIVKPVGKDAEGSPITNQEYFNIHGFIQNIVFPGLQSPDILLAGRCLVLGSNFCTVLTPDLTRQFVQAAAQCIIQQDRNLISKILAAKAINTFVEQAKENLTVKMALLEFIPDAVDSLIAFAATQPVEISAGCLETMVLMLQLDEGFTTLVGFRMTTLAIACFVKFNGDPVICPMLEDMVRALCQNQSCVLPLQQRFTPTLVSVLSSENPDFVGAQGVALDILSVIIKASPVPLSPTLMNDAFPAVIHRVFNSDDHTVLQNGGECLRAFTATSPQQVYEYRDAEGNSGLIHVVELACRLLNPTTSEFSASFVGKLVTTLIMKTGDKLGDQLELLLRAVLSKLQSADTLSVIQNLCMVYAHLINTQLEAALNFLDSVPGPTGQSALHFVMTEWTARQQCFFGIFDRKVSAIALSKLLQHGVTHNDPRLSQIQVRGDPIPDPSNVRVTRSKAAARQEQWTIIPLLVKIFKLLVHELSTFTYEEYDSDNTTDSDNEKENDTYGIGGMPHGYLGDELFQDTIELLDDPDLVHDPIYSVDLEAYLKKYLADFSTHVYYREFIQHLTPLESKVLRLAGILC